MIHKITTSWTRGYLSSPLRNFDEFALTWKSDPKISASFSFFLLLFSLSLPTHLLPRAVLCGHHVESVKPLIKDTSLRASKLCARRKPASTLIALTVKIVCCSLTFNAAFQKDVDETVDRGDKKQSFPQSVVDQNESQTNFAGLSNCFSRLKCRRLSSMLISFFKNVNFGAF